MKPRIAIPVPHTNSDYAERALPPYLDALQDAGAEPVKIPLGLENRDIARLAASCDAILLPGSRADIDPEKYGAGRDPRTNPSDPPRDNVDELLLQDAYNMRKPILGICYGLQALNVWRTGTLRQHLDTGVNHRADRAEKHAHDVTVEAGSGLAAIVGGPSGAASSLTVPVNSSHHQAVDRVGDGLRVVAHSPEDKVIEAVEGTAPGHFVLGLQWHPERLFPNDAASRAIFRALVDRARAWHEQAQAAAPDFEALGR